MDEAGLPDVTSDLRALAAETRETAQHHRQIQRRYYLLRQLLWLLAAALAGVAGVLALGGASTTVTAVAAFLSAFSTALEAKFAPAERAVSHQQRKADFADIAWRAVLAAKYAKDDDERLRQQKDLQDERYRLDRQAREI